MVDRRLAVSGWAFLLMSGCYTPEQGLLPRTGAPDTYYSTQTMPCTITIIDTRTGEPFFSIEIPPGKQFTVQFVAGKGDDPVKTPDLMRYEIFKLGTLTGTLRNSITVPNQYCRRIDVDYRPGPEVPPEPPEAALRTDQLADRPDWWTPRGGPVPDADAAMTIYDD